MAHDLRSPLRGLNGFSEALLDYGEDWLGETGRDYAERIQAASERMGTLIDELLHLSRVSRATMNPNRASRSQRRGRPLSPASCRAGEPDRHVRFNIENGVLTSPTVARSFVPSCRT